MKGNEDMGRRRGKNKRKHNQQDGFAAFDARAKEHEKRGKKKDKGITHEKVPAPFENAVLPEPIDIPQWTGE